MNPYAACGGGEPSGGKLCTDFTYSAWSSCSNGTQTRQVTASTPTGCTGGTPKLSQSCDAPSGTPCTSYTYSAWGSCSGGTQTRTVTASTPSGCTGGTPELSQNCSSGGTTCTSFTYSAWGTCTGGKQTRTVTASTPSGCTGGTPELTQNCSAGPDGAAIYAAKCASCHGALASSDVKGTSASAITRKHGTKYGTAADMDAVANALK